MEDNLAEEYDFLEERAGTEEQTREVSYDIEAFDGIYYRHVKEFTIEDLRKPDKE